jgi:nudix-type nucleoside diphosphatase (YffH/AdpP family)
LDCPVDTTSDDARLTPGNPRVRVISTTVLSDSWYVLKKSTFDFRHADGTWSRHDREIYDRGNGATILLYDEARWTVILTRQFRMPAYVNGHLDGMLLETPAGLLDGDDAAVAIRRETAEETGVVVGTVTHLFDIFMSPGSVTERVSFFAAPYTASDRVSRGGGILSEGEDIEVVELDFEQATQMVEDGEIVDGKTIILLQWAALNRFQRPT